MKFDQLRKRFGDILRQSIPPKGLSVIMKEADTNGRVDARAIIRMVTALYEYLEENQDESNTPTYKAL